ncbi:MAG: YdcF family protein, partial [Pseudobdellovibrio sp.]
KKEEYDLKILVTSGFHMTRALLSFIQAGVTDLQPAPADFLQASFAPYPNATNFYLVNLSFHEYFGMAQVFLKAKSPDLYKKTLNIF